MKFLFESELKSDSDLLSSIIFFEHSWFILMLFKAHLKGIKKINKMLAANNNVIS